MVVRNVTIKGELWVFDSSKDAHNGIDDLFTMGDTNRSNSTNGPPEMTNGIIGDESYNFSQQSPMLCFSTIMFREDNVITIFEIRYPTADGKRDPYYESVVCSFAQDQCDKISAMAQPDQ